MKKFGLSYGYIKVAAISPECGVASPEENVSNALNNVLQAISESHAQVVLLPELFISSYTCGDLFFNSRLLNQCYEQLRRFARETAHTSAVIVVGVPLLNGQQLYDCAVVLKGGRILGVVPKMYLSSSGEFNEKRWFAAGSVSPYTQIEIDGESVPFGRLLFDLNDEAVMGIEIGESFSTPVPESSVMALDGANIIVGLSAGAEQVEKNDYRVSYAKSLSSRCVCAYAQANAGIGESTSNMVFSGACILCENGAVLASSERFKDSSVAIADFDVQLLNTRRRATSFYDEAAQHKREYRHVWAEVDEIALNSVIREYSPTPFVPSKQSQINARCKDIFAIQTAALSKRMKACGFKKIVIGFYNNYGSALALFAALNACSNQGLPAENVVCITDGDEQEMKNIKSFFNSIAAKPTFISLGDLYEDDYESLHERERVMNCALLNRAESENALLLGTDTLTRAALFANPYVGVRTGMYSVNASVPVTLAHCIFNYIINLGIGTDLAALKQFADSCDEWAEKCAAGNMPPEVADFFIYYFVHNGFDAEKIMFIGDRAFNGRYSRDLMIKWVKLFVKLLFELQPARASMGDGPAIGTVSLSKCCSWNIPSDARTTAFEEFTTYDTIRRVPPITI